MQFQDAEGDQLLSILLINKIGAITVDRNKGGHNRGKLKRVMHTDGWLDKRSRESIQYLDNFLRKDTQQNTQFGASNSKTVQNSCCIISFWSVNFGIVVSDPSYLFP